MIVVKFGGHAMKDENGLFASAIKSAHSQGESVLVVHGGGPQIDAALMKAGIEPHFIGGFRVTTPEVFEIVNRVLADEVGPSLVEKLKSDGVESVALSGYREKIIKASQLEKLVDGSSAHLGWVGTVTSIDISPLKKAIESGLTVVLSPVGISADMSHGFNINADLAAAAVAGALSATQLIVMTDVAGIYSAWPDKSSLIHEISAKELSAIKGTFTEGMAPKVQACLDAINAGAKAVRIIDGRDPTAFLAALNGTGGTLVAA